MGILDSSGILKLQEQLINKGKHNKIHSENLGRSLIVMRSIGEIGKVRSRLIFAELIEDAQMNNAGWSTQNYLKSLEYMKQEENKFNK